MASADLVTLSFVEVVYGIDGMDEMRGTVLITLASDIVREYCDTTWDSDTCPAQIKLVVAQMVGDAYAQTPSDAAKVKAEQIGDYRIEYAKAAAAAMSTSNYADVLDKFTRRAYSITTSIPFDGVTDETAV